VTGRRAGDRLAGPRPEIDVRPRARQQFQPAAHCPTSYSQVADERKPYGGIIMHSFVSRQSGRRSFIQRLPFVWDRMPNTYYSR
jgi:hypothetical protein